MEDLEVRRLVARAESLLDQVAALEDTKAQSIALEAIQVLFDLYGEGLARLLNQAYHRSGDDLQAFCLNDELLSHLLLMHGLHPEPVETRVLAALEEVRPYMESHGGNVELLGIENGTVHLRLTGSCHGCGASSTTMKLAVEKAIWNVAPEIESIEAEGAVEPAPDLPEGFIPLSFVTSFVPAGTGPGQNG